MGIMDGFGSGKKYGLKITADSTSHEARIAALKKEIATIDPFAGSHKFDATTVAKLLENEKLATGLRVKTDRDWARLLRTVPDGAYRAMQSALNPAGLPVSVRQTGGMAPKGVAPWTYTDDTGEQSVPRIIASFTNGQLARTDDAVARLLDEQVLPVVVQQARKLLPGVNTDYSDPADLLSLVLDRHALYPTLVFSKSFHDEGMERVILSFAIEWRYVPQLDEDDDDDSEDD